MLKQLIHLYKQYEIVISAFRPNIRKLYWFLPGIAAGMLVAYIFAPTQFRNNAEPVQLGETYREQWVKGAIAEFEITGDEAELKRKLEAVGYAEGDVNALQNKNTNNPDLVTRIENAKPVAQAASGGATTKKEEFSNPGFFSNFVVPILVYILTCVVCFLGALYFTLWKLPFQDRIMMLLRGSKVDPEVMLRHKAEQAARAAAKEAAKQKSVFSEGPPVVQFMSTYLLGDNFYDDSFAIETPDMKFLGECGSGIAETIGVGEPKKVTATEVWIFAQNDITTLTHVLMTEHAYNDEAIRAKLAARGEPVLVEPGKVSVLETKTLRAQIKIIDMQYGEGALPPNSFFERLTIEIAVWEKEGGAGALMRDDPFEMPEPVMPLPQRAQPEVPSMPQPLQPPPMQPMQPLPPVQGQPLPSAPLPPMQPPMQPPPGQPMQPRPMQPPPMQPMQPPPGQPMQPRPMQPPPMQPMQPPPGQPMQPRPMQPPPMQPMQPPPGQPPQPRPMQPPPGQPPQARPMQPPMQPPPGQPPQQRPPQPPQTPPPSPFGDTNH